jgi:hypothetical protein
MKEGATVHMTIGTFAFQSHSTNIYAHDMYTHVFEYMYSIHTHRNAVRTLFDLNQELNKN